MDVTLTFYFKQGTFGGKQFVEIANSLLHFRPKIIFADGIMENEKRFSVDILNRVVDCKPSDHFVLFDGNEMNNYLVINELDKQQQVCFVFRNKLPEIENYGMLWGHPNFVIGYLNDDDFMMWQNETSIDRYKLYDKDISKLTIIKDSQSKKKIVDVSKNPGKYEMCNGVTVLGAYQIIIGKNFDISLFREHIISFIELAEGVNCIKIFEDISTSEEIESIEKMRRIKSLLKKNLGCIEQQAPAQQEKNGFLDKLSGFLKKL